MKNNLGYLAEGVFRTPESPVIHVIEERFAPEAIRACPFAYCLYIDKGELPEVINCVLMPDAISVSYMNTFTEYLMSQRRDNFGDVLFLLDMYHLMLLKGILFGDSYTQSFPPIAKEDGSSNNEMMESFVADSRGYLIWYHQIENILGLHFRAREEAIRFRRDLNARKAEAWDRLKDFRGGELLDFIGSRMVFGYTKKPNIYGAAALYELLKSV